MGVYVLTAAKINSLDLYCNDLRDPSQVQSVTLHVPGYNVLLKST